MRVLLSFIAFQRVAFAIGQHSLHTRFVTAEPYCETNIIYTDATSETCTGNAFQNGDTCTAECKETVTLTCNCLSNVLSFLLIANDEGCYWETDKACEVIFITKLKINIFN